MRNGLTVCTFMLSGAAPGDGGFACIPDCHKSNFIDRIPPEVRSFERRPAYVAQPPVEAGDVLIFSEALVHGTMPWAAGHQRRALLYKYSPGHSAWDQDGYRLSDYREFTLTEHRKRIMQPPSSRTATFLTAAALICRCRVAGYPKPAAPASQYLPMAEKSSSTNAWSTLSETVNRMKPRSASRMSSRRNVRGVTDR